MGAGSGEWGTGNGGIEPARTPFFVFWSKHRADALYMQHVAVPGMRTSPSTTWRFENHVKESLRSRVERRVR